MIMITAEMNKCWKMVVTSPLMSLPPFDVGSSKNGEDPTGQFPTRGSGGNCEFTAPLFLRILHPNICGVFRGNLADYRIYDRKLPLLGLYRRDDI